MTNPRPEFNINDQSLVPTDLEWTNWSYDELEVQAAQAKYGGKTIAEILPFMVEAGIGASLYFMNMPNIPFRYYIRAYVELLKPAKIEKRDRDDLFADASCLISIIESDLTNNPDRILPVMDELIPIIECIGANPANYGFEPDFEDSSSPDCADSLRLQVSAIQQLYLRLKG